jgi:hypothetical protein
MTYPPPPPPPGGSDPGSQPTQAFPPQGGYGAPPPGATPPPGAPGSYPPPGPPGAYPPGGAPPGYAPGGPPPKKGMSSGAIIGIAAVVIVAVLLAGIGIFLVTRDGDDDEPADSTTTTEESTETTEGSTESTEGTTESTEGTTETTAAPSGEFSIDGGTSTQGTVDGVNSNFHDVEVGAGVTVLITVTPLGDYDIVAEADGQTFDEGFDGDPEVIRVDGPDTFSLEISGFAGASGDYTITIEEA